MLNQLLEWRIKPAVIRCDNGPEFISHVFVNWAKKMEFVLNTFNQEILSKMPILQEPIAQLGIAGLVSIYLKL